MSRERLVAHCFDYILGQRVSPARFALLRGNPRYEELVRAR